MSTMKRFRPSTESICSRAHCVESPCSIPCAHCSLTFCLQHLLEHQTNIELQNQQNRSAVETSRKRLKFLQFNDNRHELFEQLDRWKTQSNEQIERMKNEIEQIFPQIDDEFQSEKEKILSANDQSNLENVLKTMKSARLSLVISPAQPSIRLIQPRFSPLVHQSTSPNLHRLFSSSLEINFTLDFDPNDTTLFSCSSEFLLLFRSSRSILQLFRANGEHYADVHYDSKHFGELNQIIWSSFVNGFLLSTSKQLVKLNCSTKRLGRYVELGFGFFKDLCANGDSLLVVHHLGTSLGDVIEHYSNHQLIQRCWKDDLYANELQTRETMEIFRLRMSDQLVLIDALFTDEILICDVLQAMKCLFRIDTKHYEILSISSIYDTRQWFLFVTDSQILVIDARHDQIEQQIYPLKSVDFVPNNAIFFGSDRLIVTRVDPQDEENFLFECRKIF